MYKTVLVINEQKPKNVALHKPKTRELDVFAHRELYCAPNASPNVQVRFSPFFFSWRMLLLLLLLLFFIWSERIVKTYIYTCTYHHRHRHISNEINKKNEIINQYFLFKSRSFPLPHQPFPTLIVSIIVAFAFEIYRVKF